MSVFEPEELVGSWWHSLVGTAGSYRGFPDAAVRLDDVKIRLGILFRASRGPKGIRIAESGLTASGHRLGALRRIGLGVEKMALPALDAESLKLPGILDVFPARADNESLYEWLAAWLANASARPLAYDQDPLRADIARLSWAVGVTRDTLAMWPGLRESYLRLRAAVLEVRPVRSLPPIEAEVEEAIRTLLGGRRGHDGDILAAIEGRHTADAFAAPPRYRTFLPVPVWGLVAQRSAGEAGEEEDEPGGDAVSIVSRRRNASRRPSEQSGRGDPLLLHRFETIFSISEMVNVNRKVEDDDEEGARQAADDLPELTIGSSAKLAATRLKMDLDLAGTDSSGPSLGGSETCAEWDWKRRCYLPAHCRILTGNASEEGEEWLPDEGARRAVRQVRRQFEALRPRRQSLNGQPDGDELDLSALVRAVADRKAGGIGSDRVFTSVRAASRDVSVAVLLDTSLSTDAWSDGHRILDVEKAALLAFAHGLDACGDEFGVFSFTSRRRSAVTVTTVKAFEEKLSSTVERRIQALKPGQYTRMGAAVRHVARLIEARPARCRLLLMLTDGKPNDIDYYEGRYGIEDTRVAIRDARKAGLRVFGITVDADARDYVPYIFGPGAFAMVPRISRLPMALPALYRQLTT
jgi:nitric oxide reductase NorD protein